MRILITNDDSYKAKGVNVLAQILKPFGEVLMIAPKYVQSGMGMAVNLKREPVGLKDLGIQDGVHKMYFNGTPAACVKIGINYLCWKPDVIVSGINHGSNACAAMLYSGTLGATAEGAVNGIPSIGVSLDSFDPDADFSAVQEHFPAIFQKLMENYQIDVTAAPCHRVHGIYYNVNFPSGEVKGVRVGIQGRGRWIKEWSDYVEEAYLEKHPEGFSPAMQKALAELEEGEKAVVIGGEYEDDPNNDGTMADHRLNMDGYISVVPHNIDCTDYEEAARLQTIF